jgi:CheY-like chemotaxis protein
MSPAFAARRPVVLIVEDDLLIRLQAAQIISEAEFDVLEASSADEAISILEARSDITVLFTDIQMPGSMDGLKLAAAVKGRWPPIKIVATSGLVDVRLDDLPEGGRFIPKPYNPVQLAETFQDLTADLRRSMDVQGHEG